MAEAAFSVYKKKKSSIRESSSMTSNPSATLSEQQAPNNIKQGQKQSTEQHVQPTTKKSTKRKYLKSQNSDSCSKLNISIVRNDQKGSSNETFIPKSFPLKLKSAQKTKKPRQQKFPIESNTIACSTGEKAVQLLEWLLAPLKSAEFFSTYWEKQALHIQHNDPKYYETILTTTDIDKMLRKHPLHFGRNVDLVHYVDGEKVVESPEGRAMASIVWDAFSQGNSVRILNPQTYSYHVHLLLETLQELFGTLVGANVYLTPPGSQGFAPHFDDIEAFVIQLEGRKHWKLYKPKNDKHVLARFSSNDFSRDELGELIFDNVLDAGDILYFPRGIVHEAKTDGDAHSLHITVSAYQCTSYADIMEVVLPQALTAAVDDNVDFRKGLPLNYLKHLGIMNKDCRTAERMQVFKTMHSLFLKVADYFNIDAAADELGRKFMHEALPPALDDAEAKCSSSQGGPHWINKELKNRNSITMATEVRLVRAHACRLVQRDAEYILLFSTQNARVHHGEEEQYIVVDANLCPVVELLHVCYPSFIAVSSLQKTNEQQLIDFVLMLWDYGIIVTKRPLE